MYHTTGTYNAVVADPRSLQYDDIRTNPTPVTDDDRIRHQFRAHTLLRAMPVIIIENLDPRTEHTPVTYLDTFLSTDHAKSVEIAAITYCESSTAMSLEIAERGKLAITTNLKRPFAENLQRALWTDPLNPMHTETPWMNYLSHRNPQEIIHHN